MVAPADRYYPIDARMLFVEDQTLTADDVVAVGGSDVVLHLGEGRVDAAWILDVETIAIDGSDELYDWYLELGDAEAFDGDIEIAASMHLGDTAVRPGGAIDSTVGRYVQQFSNQVNGVIYPWARLRLDGTGSTFSIKFSSWLSLNVN
jgi:hypothetical protein